MELNEHKAAMHSTNQPKLYDNKFSSYSVLTFSNATKKKQLKFEKIFFEGFLLF